MKPLRLSVLCLLASILCLLPTGCGTLDKSGVYAGDQFLYNSELAISTSYDVIHTFVKWEYENRDALANIPEIKQSADAMRAHAKDWFRTANALHDAYRIDPTAPNKAALQAALDILRTALAEATRYMAQAAAPENQ